MSAYQQTRQQTKTALTPLPFLLSSTLAKSGFIESNLKSMRNREKRKRDGMCFRKIQVHESQPDPLILHLVRAIPAAAAATAERPLHCRTASHRFYRCCCKEVLAASLYGARWLSIRLRPFRRPYIVGPRLRSRRYASIATTAIWLS